MKKLVLMASFFMAFAVSAQQGRGQQAPIKEGQRSESGFRQQPQHYQDKFAGIKLSKAQQKKIDALDRQRIAQNLYDVKVKQILSKSQYERYLKNTQSRGFAQVQHGQYSQQGPKGDVKPFRK